MRSMSRRRRRWNRWERYITRLIKLSEHTAATDGMVRYYNDRARVWNRHQNKMQR